MVLVNGVGVCFSFGLIFMISSTRGRGAGRAFNSCIVVVANFLYVVAVSSEEMVSWSPSMNTILVQTLYCSTQAHRCIPIVKKLNPKPKTFAIQCHQHVQPTFLYVLNVCFDMSSTCTSCNQHARQQIQNQRSQTRGFKKKGVNVRARPGQ